ncbi:MAG: hypothetical protein Q8R08_00800 [bacterium]|nr:hypothetical protein [bacterium]
MYAGAMCGPGYCWSSGKWSKKDELAMLEEHEKIFEAKLATIRHMKENVKVAKEE